MLKLKTGQTPGLTHWPVTRPDPVKIAYPMTRERRPGSVSGRSYALYRVLSNSSLHYTVSAIILTADALLLP